MTQKKICLSMSDCKLFNLLKQKSFGSWVTHIVTNLQFNISVGFSAFAVHPESWNPMWSVSRSECSSCEVLLFYVVHSFVFLLIL